MTHFLEEFENNLEKEVSSSSSSRSSPSEGTVARRPLTCAVSSRLENVWPPQTVKYSMCREGQAAAGDADQAGQGLSAGLQPPWRPRERLPHLHRGGGTRQQGSRRQPQAGRSGKIPFLSDSSPQGKPLQSPLLPARIIALSCFFLFPRTKMSPAAAAAFAWPFYNLGHVHALQSPQKSLLILEAILRRSACFLNLPTPSTFCCFYQAVEETPVSSQRPVTFANRGRSAAVCGYSLFFFCIC